MTTAVAPAWPPRVIAIASQSGPVARGRPAEFLHHGVILIRVPTATAALIELGRDPEMAAILVPGDLKGMDLEGFLPIVRQFMQTPVILGFGSQERMPTGIMAGSLDGLVTAMLPVTPLRLSQALQNCEPSATASHVVEVGELVLDADAFRVWWHGAEVRLPLRPFEMLRYLMEAAPRAVGREELMSEFVRPGISWRSDSVSTGIGRIREALQSAVPAVPVPIETVKKVGYRIATGNGLAAAMPSSEASAPTRVMMSSSTLRTREIG